MKNPLEKKNTLLFIIITALCTLTGIIFFLIQRNILIVRWAFGYTWQPTTTLTQETVTNKTFRFYFWKNEKFHQEDRALIWHSSDYAKNITQLVTHWLACQQEEKILPPSINLLQGTIATASQEAFLIFSTSLFNKEWPIIKKWMLLESLCTTIKESGLPVATLHFFVHQHPMDDPHLDLSQPWPIEGFINQKTT